jgi:hypothetical protein
MLYSIDGKHITTVPHSQEWNTLLAELGAANDTAIRQFLNALIDAMPPALDTGLRTFNSSYLGSSLSPWPAPLVEIYHAARRIRGSRATEDDVQDYSGQLFGLMMWQIMIDRHDSWHFYSEKADLRDASHVRLGKVYFEQVQKS